MATKVRLRSGTEGPRHDPYGWNEISVDREGHTATLHSSGLFNDWLEVDGVRFEGREIESYWLQRNECERTSNDSGGYQLLRRIFRNVLGYWPEEFEEAQNQADARNPYFGCDLGCYE